MNGNSTTEENYLKAILKISMDNDCTEVGASEIAELLLVKVATVSDMLKKLRDKKLVDYQKYGKITLTTTGKKQAMYIVRKHRLWETFLYNKLDFSWDEVHEIAEQLEHIQSVKLIDKLDEFLNYPTFDPHGDPIPNKQGVIKTTYKQNLSKIEVGKSCKMVAVKDNSTVFLQYVVKVGLSLNHRIKVISKNKFDLSIEIEVGKKRQMVSHKFAENILVV